MSTADPSRASTKIGFSLPPLDSPEYLARLQTPFTPPPPSLTLKSIHAAVPKDAFEKSTIKSLWWVGRHVAIVSGLGWLALNSEWVINNALKFVGEYSLVSKPESWRGTIDWAFWITYWFWESVAFTGMWTLGGSYGLRHFEGHDCLLCLDSDRS